MERPPSDTLFIAGLPTSMDDAQLKHVFAAYGNIQMFKGLSGGQDGRRAALVQFGNVNEAQWMVDNLNGNIPQGLSDPIRVQFKRQEIGKGGDGPYTGGPPGKGVQMAAPRGVAMKVLVDGLYASGAMPGSRGGSCPGIFCGGLPPDTTDLDLYKIFSCFGPIVPRGVKVIMDEDGLCRGFGFVNFKEAPDANNAINTLNGTQMPDGSILRVNFKRDQAHKGGEKGLHGAANLL
eukprot:TRINITY_DN103991_c0_g1_i1.p1 TRINITY_DN103991_c0_g1~~TRINITY_DN103991_c0_g1_i1.p1  ORF type:complete len:234 (-),score=49.21 TRINITY_DN103991_c0_g1_i1:240-941(-)